MRRPSVTDLADGAWRGHAAKDADRVLPGRRERMAGMNGPWRPEDPAGSPGRDHVGSARDPDEPDGPLARLLTAASGAARRVLARPGGRALATVGAVLLLAGAG